ncbi:MAG: sigma-70 family RNA polymerase sigma factor [Planctomycetota bacterium]|jgi:RNA polymerase sigma factor for flagellar operon FliA|nr:sigma-70 family RNA polymerase sigma factor [Planctomycetota bacterium]
MVSRGKRNDAQNETLVRLWTEYCDGDRIEARNALIEFYRPFAASVVRRVKSRLPRSVEVGDLEGAGDVGLIQAIHSFDPQRGVPFEAFCEHRVRGAIIDELRRLDWLPRPMRNRLNQRKKVIDQLRTTLDREPADNEVAAELGMSMKEYMKRFGAGKDTPVLAGSKQSDYGGDSEPGLDFLEDVGAEGPDEEAHRREMLAAISASLDSEGREILFKRYFENRSLKEIGEELGLSQSRVSKILGRLVGRLKDRFEDKVH